MSAPGSCVGHYGLERAILLTKERDHISLLLLQPCEDRGEEHL